MTMNSYSLVAIIAALSISLLIATTNFKVTSAQKPSSDNSTTTTTTIKDGTRGRRNFY